MQSLTFSLSSLSDMCSSGASFASTAAPSSLVSWERSIMLTETTISVWFRTSGAPMSSVIMPRTAGTTICLVWFTSASLLVLRRVEHLQVPEPAAERDQQRRRDHVQAE